MMSSSRDRRVLMSTCWPGWSSMPGSGLFMVFDSDWAILFMSYQSRHLWRRVTFHVKITEIIKSHLDQSIWRDVLQLFVGWGGVRRRNLTCLPLFKGICFWILFSRTSVSEDAHNEKIDGKHDDWTLNSDHNLLPGELDVTCKESFKLMFRGLKRRLLLRLWVQLFQLRLQKHLTTELPHLYFLPNVTEI